MQTRRFRAHVCRFAPPVLPCSFRTGLRDVQLRLLQRPHAGGRHGGSRGGGSETRAAMSQLARIEAEQNQLRARLGLGNAATERDDDLLLLQLKPLTPGSSACGGLGEPVALDDPAAVAAASSGDAPVGKAGRVDRALTREVLELVSMNAQLLRSLHLSSALGGLQGMGSQF